MVLTGLSFVELSDLFSILDCTLGPSVFGMVLGLVFRRRLVSLYAATLSLVFDQLLLKEVFWAAQSADWFLHATLL